VQNFDIYRFMADRGIEGVTKPAKNALNITVTSAKTGMPIQGASIRILLPTDDGFIGQTNNEFYKISLDQDPSNPKSLKFSLVRKEAEDLGTADHYSNAVGKAETELIRYRPALILVSYPGYSTKERFIAVDKENDYNLNFSLPDAPICLRANGLVLSENYGTRIGNARLKFINKENDQKTEIRTDINGQFSACLPAEGKYLLQVERDGFKGENFSLDVQKTTELFQEVRMRPLTKVASAEEALPLASTLQNGSIIRMEQVFYEKNRSTLNQNAIRSVEGLIELLQRFPQMHVELYTHTDTRGETGQNMQLTKAQAANIATYLEYRERELNIQGDERFSKRVICIGKGDTQPMNHCKKTTDCSDVEHQQNNRVEVKVVKVGTIQRP
jgi:outer membrane protein OmpA-like peptidoglycan-associated protein